MFRNWLLTFAAAFVCVGFSATAQEAAGVAKKEPVHIEAGMLAHEDDAVAWFQEQIASFMEANPDVVVDAPNIRGSKKELMKESIPSMPANVMSINSWWRYQVAFLAQQNMLAPIDGFLPDPGFDPSIFYENAWDAVTYDGKKWGIPWQLDSVVLAYDFEMFEKAGLPGPPKTTDDFFAYIERLNKAGTDGTQQYGTGIWRETDFAALLMYLIMSSGHLVYHDNRFDLQGPEVNDAFEKVRGVFRSKAYCSGSEIGVKYRCGMIFAKIDQACKLVATGRYRLAPLPVVQESVYPSYGRQYLVIRRSTAEKQAASWRFVKWISRKDAPLPEVWTGFPCRKDIVGRPEVKKSQDPSYQNLALFMESASHSATGFSDVRNLEKAGAPLAVAFFAALYGNGDFPTLAAKAEHDLNSLIQIIAPPTSGDNYSLYK
jgi:ABC-type glycerol-3-phosphate transport system substrate-binding protein